MLHVRISLLPYVFGLVLLALFAACGEDSGAPSTSPADGRATATLDSDRASPTVKATSDSDTVSPTVEARSTARPPLTQTSPETDREALVAFYNATGGPNWGSKSNWLSDSTLDSWSGVSTDRNGRVIRLRLDGKQLSGEIPPELGNLTYLEELELPRNRLSGEIPPELGNLANLEGLWLNVNELSGEIPPELGNLVNLKSLALWKNRLSGEIPPELGNLANLEELSLSFNELSGEIPPELGNLANLQELSLHTNQLSGEIPPELGNLTNLQELSLDSKFTGCLPTSLSQLPILSGGPPFCPGSSAPSATEGISIGSEPTLVEYIAWMCGGGRWEDYGEFNPQTFGEVTALGDRMLDDIESITPPKEFKGFHSATIALTRGYQDLYRSQDANEPYDRGLEYREFENTDKGEALRHAWAAAYVDDVTALDDEAISQLVDAGLGDVDCTN